MKKGFVIYGNQIDALKALDGDTFKKCVLTMAEYALDGVEYTGDESIIQMFMTLVKPQVDANNKRYDNAIKGGRPKKEEKPKITQETETAKEIIAYLNEKTGKHFRVTDAAKRHINARLNEKYTIEDFKTVIDKKCAEWKGTKFDQYLKPDTLFSTKFDGYLNQHKTRANGVTVPMPEFMEKEIKQTQATQTTLDEVKKLQEQMKWNS